jgi:hypothetical protein
MNTLWKIVGYTKVDVAIRQQCGMQPIREWINKRSEDWHNHIVRDNFSEGRKSPV